MRNRILKEGFFRNYELAQLPPLARILFEGLWLIADKEGRLWDRPQQIKAEVLPYDDCNADDLLAQLANSDFIFRYESQGKKCIEVANFSKHQPLTTWEKNNLTSDIPARCKTRKTSKVQRTDNGTSTEEQQTDACRTSESIVSISESVSESIKDKSIVACEATPCVQVFDYWKQEHGKRSTTIFSVERKRAVEKRLKDGNPVEYIMQAIRGIKLDPHCSGKNDNGTIYNDLELICRDQVHLDRFASLDEPRRPRATESPPEICSKCLNTGVRTAYDPIAKTEVQRDCNCDYGLRRSA